MAEYVVSWFKAETLERSYVVFNSSDSIKNREEAMKLYGKAKADKDTTSTIFSKIIESHRKNNK